MRFQQPSRSPPHTDCLAGTTALQVRAVTASSCKSASWISASCVGAIELVRKGGRVCLPAQPLCSVSVFRCGLFKIPASREQGSRSDTESVLVEED